MTDDAELYIGEAVQARGSARVPRSTAYPNKQT